MEISLKEIDMKEVVTKAIFDSLEEKKKEQLIKAALESLLTVGNSSYNRTSPLQDAFNDAVRIKSREIISEKLANDEAFKAELNKLISEAMTKFFTQKREEAIDKMVDGLMYIYTKDRY